MFTVTLINMLIVILVVVIHYECLLRLNDWLPRLRLWSRFRIVAGVFGRCWPTRWRSGASPWLIT